MIRTTFSSTTWPLMNKPAAPGQHRDRQPTAIVRTARRRHRDRHVDRGNPAPHRIREDLKVTGITGRSGDQAVDPARAPDRRLVPAGRVPRSAGGDRRCDRGASPPHVHGSGYAEPLTPRLTESPRRRALQGCCRKIRVAVRATARTALWPRPPAEDPTFRRTRRCPAQAEL